ncbi:MAG TPA: EAL domain-containing protein [Candidatus Limnocylindrales bacterium]|nr:EAL domain-containing protein [Candidatus Limnocylindrales bacterium]
MIRPTTSADLPVPGAALARRAARPFPRERGHATGRRVKWIPRRRESILGAALIGYALLYAAALIGPVAIPGDRTVMAVGALVPIRCLAAALALLVARDRRLDGDTRRAWRLLGAAASLYAAGTAVTAAAAVGGLALPFPSPVDALLLAFYPVAFAALVAFPAVPQARADRLRLMFDVAIWVVGGGIVVWVAVLSAAGPHLGDDPIAAATTLGYPLGDLMLLSGLATATLRQSFPHQRRALTLLLGGIAALFVDDIAWSVLSSKGLYAPGHPIDALWMASTVLLALAALEQRKAAALPRRAASPAVPMQRLGVTLVPYAFLTAGYWALLAHLDPTFSMQTIQLAAGSTGLGALVIGRQIVGLRENGRLLRLQAERESAMRFESIIRNASDVVLVVTPDGTIQYASPSSARMLGRSATSLVGRPLDGLLSSEATVNSLLRSDHAGAFELPAGLRHADGHRLDVECTVADLRDDPAVRGFAITIRDVTERRVYQGRLRHQALHDGLTQLANRHLFHDRIERALAQRTAAPGQIAVLLLDLDDFRKVNDSLGHATGDAVLVHVGERLRQAVRPGDTVARLGGDEFGVLLEHGLDADEPRSCAQRILEAMAAPFDIFGDRIELSVSVGIRRNPRDATADELMRDADVAMYDAKAGGKGRFVEFEEAMHQAVAMKLAFEADLRQGLARGEFTLQFQPIVDLTSGRVRSLEALVRWRHPERGNVPPATFIPVAEEIGYIVPLGRWILLRACRDLAALHAAGSDPDLAVSVNVSVRQLSAPEFAADVATALETHGLRPRHLILEVTESLMIDDHQGLIDELARIRATGVRIALDDFGTGYSSLAYLNRLPVDVLKIDRAFIDRLDDDGQDEPDAVVTAIVKVGQAIGLQIVAEGVERESQRARLAAIGCDFAQGYWYARPVDPADVQKTIAACERRAVAVA